MNVITVDGGTPANSICLRGESAKYATNIEAIADASEGTAGESLNGILMRRVLDLGLWYRMISDGGDTQNESVMRVEVELYTIRDPFRLIICELRDDRY